MRLEEYLSALDSCPDNELKNRCGIGDNWPILLNADQKIIIEDLQNSGKFAMREVWDEKNTILNYSAGNIVVKITDFIHGGSLIGVGGFKLGSEEANAFYKKLQTNYNMSLVLHQNQKEKIIEGISKERAAASVIKHLSEYVLNKKIPACLPKSNGIKHIKDMSRIAYNP